MNALSENTHNAKAASTYTHDEIEAILNRNEYNKGNARFEKIAALINKESRAAGQVLKVAPLTAIQCLALANHDRVFKVKGLRRTLPRLISMLLMNSGGGKNFHLKLLRSVASQYGVSCERHITSDKSLKESVYTGTKKAFYAIDEAQGLLAQVKGKEAHQKNIMPALNIVITDETVELTTRERIDYTANRKKRFDFLQGRLEKDPNFTDPEQRRYYEQQRALVSKELTQAQDEQESVVIKDFYVGAYLCSQPETFRTIVSQESLSSGFLARALICKVDELPSDESGLLEDTEDECISNILNLIEKVQSFRQPCGHWLELGIKPETLDLLLGIKLYFGRAEMKNHPTMKSLYNRVLERTVQISCLTGSLYGAITSEDVIHALRMVWDNIKTIEDILSNSNEHGSVDDAMNFAAKRIGKEFLKDKNKDKALGAGFLRNMFKGTANQPLANSIALRNKDRREGKATIRNDFIDVILTVCVRDGYVEEVPRGYKITEKGLNYFKDKI